MIHQTILYERKNNLPKIHDNSLKRDPEEKNQFGFQFFDNGHQP